MFSSRSFSSRIYVHNSILVRCHICMHFYVPLRKQVSVDLKLSPTCLYWLTPYWFYPHSTQKAKAPGIGRLSKTLIHNCLHFHIQIGIKPSWQSTFHNLCLHRTFQEWRTNVLLDKIISVLMRYPAGSIACVLTNYLCISAHYRFYYLFSTFTYMLNY